MMNVFYEFLTISSLVHGALVKLWLQDTYTSPGCAIPSEMDTNDQQNLVSILTIFDVGCEGSRSTQDG